MPSTRSQRRASSNGWLRVPRPDEVRPFHVIVAAAVAALDVHAHELRSGLAQVQRDFADAAQRRAEFEEVLGEMDVRDALLIRNELAPGLDEQRLTIEHLQDRHAFVLGDVSRNALDQRIKRARVKSKVALARRRPALIDLLREARLGGVR